MITILTVVAAIASVVLVISAIGATARVTDLDRATPGPWGIVSWRQARARRLDAHARRWHTMLSAGRDDDARWRDFVIALGGLDRAAGAQPDTAPPASFDRRWTEERLSLLEARIAPDPTEGGER